MDKYLNRAEQLFLLQGKADGYAGMNGVELINSLEDAEQRFLEWYYHTQFEMSYEKDPDRFILFAETGEG